MTEYLAPQELHTLTGFARAAAQAAWLTERGVPHRRDGSRMIVSREHVRAWLEGKSTVFSAGPNWSAVK